MGGLHIVHSISAGVKKTTLKMEQIKIGLKEILFSCGSWKIKLIKLADFFLGSLIAGIVKEKTASATLQKPLQRLLVIRPGGIGDTVFLLPFLRALKRENPVLTVDILCEKRNTAVFLSSPALCDKIYRYDQVMSFFSLFGNRYDIVVDTEQWHYLSGLVAYFIPSGQKIGFATRPLRARLFTEKTQYENGEYEINNFRNLFGFILPNTENIKDINSCFEVKETEFSWAKSAVPENSVSLCLGASIPERRFKNSESIPLIQFILSKGFHVILLGGNDVAPLSRVVSSKISDNRIHDFVGRASLPQSAALIQRSKLFIGTDSGLMHLACAVGTQVIAMFGPDNVDKWKPTGEEHTIIIDERYGACYTYFGYTIIPRSEE